MDIRVKKELDKMLLLMERMDNHHTLMEAMEKEERIEHTRDTYTDIDQFLQDVNLGRSFVGLCYIQGYEIKKIYPTNPEVDKNGMTVADRIRGGVGKMDQTSRGWGKLNGLINDPEFTKPTGRLYAGNRSMANNPFAGILKITNYVFNWGGASEWGKFNKDYFQGVQNARISGGFGKPDSSYPQDDWHRNPMYHGIDIRPESSTGGRESYGQRLDAKNSIYGFSDAFGNAVYSSKPDGTQYQKRAFKFGLKDITKQWSKFCIVDGSGEIDDIEQSLGAVFGKLPGEFTDLRKKITMQMKQDEIAFINNISALDSNYNRAKKVWLLDNVAYIVASEVDPITHTRRYVRYINPDITIDKINVDPSEMKAIVEKEISKTETAVKYKIAAEE